MNIGNNLRTIRIKNKISQQDIANFLGVDRKTYNTWEAGSADIKSSYLPKLAEYLHIEISDLFADKPHDIIINQNYRENKDNSINGVVILLTDKDAVNQLVETLKGGFRKTENSESE